jgi:hypothetical protein
MSSQFAATATARVGKSRRLRDDDGVEGDGLCHRRYRAR